MRIGSDGVVSRWSLFPVLFVAAACDGGAPRADPFRATGEVIAMGGGDGGVASACVTCHGLKGEGDGGRTPRLAGLDAGYLHRQLDDYANGRRENLMMRSIVRRLSGADRAKVSAYYAALPVPTATPAPGTAMGRRVYAQQCASCHGAAGEGVGPGNPRLAGQPAAYIEQQLIAWRTSKRRGDGLNEMLTISRGLSPDEVRAVATHAAALPGARPSQVRAAYP